MQSEQLVLLSRETGLSSSPFFFVSEVHFTDKYNSLPHKEVLGFFRDIFIIIFLSPAFL